MWKFVTIPLSILCLGMLAVKAYDRWLYEYPDMFGSAWSHTVTLAGACKVYTFKPQHNGKWPERLEDLVLDKPGDSHVLDGGLASLTDPWGKRYRYALVETEEGTFPYVWTERVSNGKLLVFGARVMPNGRAIPFARPED